MSQNQQRASKYSALPDQTSEQGNEIIGAQDAIVLQFASAGGRIVFHPEYETKIGVQNRLLTTDVVRRQDESESGAVE